MTKDSEKFTKQQRLEIYKQMLSLLVKSFTEDNMDNCTLCYILWDIKSNSDLKDFPEILKYKPKKLYNGYFWFKVNQKGTRKRINILMKAIKDLS